MKFTNVALNFQDKYYMFYDWLETDCIDNKSNGYIYKVSSRVVNDFIKNKIKLTNLDIIKKSNKIIFTDCYSFVAIEFAQNGESLYKSSLLLKDEIKLSSKLELLDKKEIDYVCLDKDIFNKDIRISEEIKNTIKIELRTLVENEHFDKLEYLFYEWFNKKEKTINKMIELIEKKLADPITKKEEYIYDLIKKSYKLV